MGTYSFPGSSHTCDHAILTTDLDTRYNSSHFTSNPRLRSSLGDFQRAEIGSGEAKVQSRSRFFFLLRIIKLFWGQIYFTMLLTKPYEAEFWPLTITKSANK